MADDAVIRDLQARLRRLEDLEEIRRLYLDYGMSLDAREAANYASLFSSDAKLRLGPVMKGDGPKEIEQAAREMFSRTPEGGRSYAHILNAPQIGGERTLAAMHVPQDRFDAFWHRLHPSQRAAMLTATNFYRSRPGRFTTPIDFKGLADTN